MTIENERATDDCIGFITHQTKINLVVKAPTTHLLLAKQDWIDSVCTQLGEYVRPAAESIVSWIHHSELIYNNLGSQCSYGRGALLHGPSGVGKNYLVDSILAIGG